MASEQCTGVSIIYLSSADMHGARSDILDMRWEGVLPIPGLQKQHMFQSGGQNRLLIGRFSSDILYKEVSFARHPQYENIDEQHDNHEMGLPMKNKPAQLYCPQVGDWVLVNYDGSLFPGEVKSAGDQEVQVKVMVASGSYYKWPKVEDCIFYRMTDVFRKLSPPIVKSGRDTYGFIEKW